MDSNRLALQHLPHSHGGRCDQICSLQCTLLFLWLSFTVSCFPLAHLFHTLPGSLRAQLCSPRTFQKWVWTAWLTVSTLCRRFHFVMFCTLLEAMSAPQLWVGVRENIILFLCTKSCNIDFQCHHSNLNTGVTLKYIRQVYFFSFVCLTSC